MFVEIITPHLPERRDQLHRLQLAIEAQDYDGPIIHTVVWDGQQAAPFVVKARPNRWVRHYSVDGPHYDRGAWAVTWAVTRSNCPAVLQIADDDDMAPDCISKLVAAWSDEVDVVMPWMTCFDGGGKQLGSVTGDPPVRSNLTSGLFRPALFQEVGTMICGPSGRYEQPGADGVMVWDWLEAGARLKIVPEFLLEHHG